MTDFPPLIVGDGFLRGARACLGRPSGCFLVHKTTMGQINLSNLLLKPMLPAKVQIHATIGNHNAGASPSSSSTASLQCKLQPRVCHLCCISKLVGDWDKEWRDE